MFSRAPRLRARLRRCAPPLGPSAAPHFAHFPARIDGLRCASGFLPYSPLLILLFKCSFGLFFLAGYVFLVLLVLLFFSGFFIGPAFGQFSYQLSDLSCFFSGGSRAILGTTFGVFLCGGGGSWDVLGDAAASTPQSHQGGKHWLAPKLQLLSLINI